MIDNGACKLFFRLENSNIKVTDIIVLKKQNNYFMLRKRCFCHFRVCGEEGCWKTEHRTLAFFSFVLLQTFALKVPILAGIMKTESHSHSDLGIFYTDLIQKFVKMIHRPGFTDRIGYLQVNQAPSELALWAWEMDVLSLVLQTAPCTCFSRDCRVASMAVVAVAEGSFWKFVSNVIFA